MQQNNNNYNYTNKNISMTDWQQQAAHNNLQEPMTQGSSKEGYKVSKMQDVNE